MDQARIAELLRPFLTWPLSDSQLGSISMYIDILLKWNQRINLTAVRDAEEIVTRHFGESLFAAQALFTAGSSTHVGAGALTRPAERSSALQRRPSASTSNEIEHPSPAVIDVGSGAGFPGLPIKMWAPFVRLTLIESNHKKATFLKEVVRALGLEGVEVFSGRAESYPAASADVVTLRAVERFQEILPIATELARIGGRVALLIGAAQVQQAKQVCEDIAWGAPTPIPASTSRMLLHGEKTTAVAPETTRAQRNH